VRDEVIGEALSHFRIDAKLGEGGMGVVYRATDLRLHREVALKVLPAWLAGDPARRGRFLREARAAAAVSHANIATVHDIGEAEGHVYIAMELVDGETLRARLAAQLPVAEVLRVARDLARGLARAHDAGVVHRDLKPENVMISAEGDVKILDFGIAKILDCEDPRDSSTETAAIVTAEGRAMGTPPYMSPEQAAGRADVDARSDVFSFGVMLYEMLAGRRPFGADTTVGTLYAVLHSDPPPLAQLAPADTPTQVIDVVSRCLAKRREDRFSSARELLHALDPEAARRRSDLPPALLADAKPEIGTPYGATLLPDTPPPLAPAQAPPTIPRGPSARWPALGAALIVGTVAAVSTYARRHVESPPAARPSSATLAVPSPPKPRPKVVARRLTAVTDRELLTAALSPDGTRLLFADPEAFWLQSVAGSPPHRFAATARGEPKTATFVSGGTEVLLSLHDGDDVVSYVAAADGGPPRKVTGLRGSTWLAPDGRTVATIRDRRSVEVTSLDGSSTPRLVRTCAIRCNAAAWSPDGARLLVYEIPATLEVVRSDGSESHLLLTDPALMMDGTAALAWPAPDRIVFGSHAPEPGRVTLRELTVDAEGQPVGQPREIWTTPGMGLMGLSVAGERMAVVVTERADDVYTASLTPDGEHLVAPPKRLSPSEASDGWPTWLQDGRVAYYSERERHPALYAQGLSEAEPTSLVASPVLPVAPVVLRGGDLVYGRPDPEPDATHVHTFASPGHVFVGRSGGPERGLEVAANRFTQVRCTEASHCVISPFDGQATQLARLDLTSGRVDEPFYTKTGRVRFDVSPDGTSVVTATGDEVLTFVSPVDGTTRSVSTLPSGRLQSVSFARDGRSILVAGVGFAAVRNGVLRVALDGRGTLLYRGAANAWISTPTLSHDGRSIAWGEQRSIGNVWLVEPE
jgi:serine/threonine protein kinase